MSIKVLVAFESKDTAKCRSLNVYVTVPDNATPADVYQAAFDWWSAQERKANWQHSVTMSTTGEHCDIADYDVEIEHSLGFTE